MAWKVIRICVLFFTVQSASSSGQVKKTREMRAISPAWLSCPLPAVFSGSPLRGHRRVFHADGHSVLKVRRGRFGNKKSPQNKPNLTTPSGEVLIQVGYVAIRESKTALAVLPAERNHFVEYVTIKLLEWIPIKFDLCQQGLFQKIQFWQDATKGIKNFGKKIEGRIDSDLLTMHISDLHTLFPGHPDFQDSPPSNCYKAIFAPVSYCR